MDEKYSNAIIDSTTTYVYDLQYLARDNKKTLKDIHTLGIICNVYNWTEWYEVSEDDKIKIQKLMDCMFFRNSNLTLPTVVPGFYYSNVNTPQTIYTWQRIYDDPDVITHEVIGDVPLIYGFSYTFPINLD